MDPELAGEAYADGVFGLLRLKVENLHRRDIDERATSDRSAVERNATTYGEAYVAFVRPIDQPVSLEK